MALVAETSKTDGDRSHTAEFEKEVRSMTDKMLKDYLVRCAVKLQSRILFFFLAQRAGSPSDDRPSSAETRS